MWQASYRSVSGPFPQVSQSFFQLLLQPIAVILIMSLHNVLLAVVMLRDETSSDSTFCLLSFASFLFSFVVLPDLIFLAPYGKHFFEMVAQSNCLQK